MENTIITGRPKTEPNTHKKSRAISLTDEEFSELKRQASENKLGISSLIIKKLKLNKATRR